MKKGEVCVCKKRGGEEEEMGERKRDKKVVLGVGKAWAEEKNGREGVIKCVRVLRERKREEEGESKGKRKGRRERRRKSVKEDLSCSY